MKTSFFPKTRAVLLAAAIACGVAPAALQAHSMDPALFPSMIEALTAELAKSPEPDLFIQRGELHAHRKEWKKADADFAAAAGLDPQRLVINLLRGRALLEGGEPGKARPFLDRYLEQKASQPEPWFLRGQIFAALGRTEQARADYAEGFRRASEPGLEQLLAWRRLLAALPDTDPAAVLAILDAAIAQLGPAPVLVDFAIEREIARKNYEGALARIERAVAHRRWPGPLLALRGDILEKAGQRRAAASAYHEVLAAIEKLPERNRDLPDVQTLAGSARDAIARLSTAP